MSRLSSPDLRRWATWSDHGDEPPPPYSSEDPKSKCILDSIPGTLMPWAEKALPTLPATSSSQKPNSWSAKAKQHTRRTSEPLFHLGPITLWVGRDRYFSTAYLLKIRSSKTITLFRSDSNPTPASSSSRTPEKPALLPKVCPVYDIIRSEQGKGSSVSLDSKTKDNLFSEPSSRLKLDKTEGLETNNVWELYYHRNYDFESLVGVPAPGPQLLLVFDKSSTWRERGGRVVAEEGKTGIYQNHRGLKAGADYTRLPRIDISGGLDQRFVDLIVACWAAKAYFA